jgi:hypothetical protein
MKKIMIILSFLPLIWLSACKEKLTEVDYNPNVLSSKDYIRAEDAVFEIVNIFFKGVYDTAVVNHGYGVIDQCTVSYSSAENLLNFSYGTYNKHCDDYKDRKGQFNANFSGQIFEEGVIATIITDSLFVDDSLVVANLEITNLGLNNDNLPEFSLKVLSGLIRFPDTTKMNGVSITTDFVMVWAEGSATPADLEDDMYSITGNASGLSCDLYEFSVIIQDPLLDYLDCFWISQGTSQITVPAGEFPTGTIDYIISDGCFNEMYFYFNDNLFYDKIK